MIKLYCSSDDFQEAMLSGISLNDVHGNNNNIHRDSNTAVDQSAVPFARQ